MRKLTNTFLLAVVMCMLLACAGCASQNAASSASASASAESSATTSQASSANTTETSAGAGATVDPSNMTDGEYSVEVSLQGGSGKASVESPTKLIVEGGKMKAVIVWSSSNYDLMVVDRLCYGLSILLLPCLFHLHILGIYHQSARITVKTMNDVSSTTLF